MARTKSWRCSYNTKLALEKRAVALGITVSELMRRSIENRRAREANGIYARSA